MLVLSMVGRYKALSGARRSPQDQDGRAVILFDVDDTLLVDYSVARLAAARTLAEAGLPADETVVNAVMAIARSLWRVCPFRDYVLTVGISSWEALWADPLTPATAVAGIVAWTHHYQTETWRQVVEAHDCWADPWILSRRYIAHRRALLRPKDGAVPILEALRRRHRLWAVTNGDYKLQHSKLKLSGLACFFERVFVSAEQGAAKPAPQFFAPIEKTLADEGVSVCMLVGDSLSKDIRTEESSNPVDGRCSPDHAAPSGLAVRLDHLLVGLCVGWDGAGAYHSGCCLIQVATAARSIGPLVSTSSTGPSRPSGPTPPSSAALSWASST